jgi:hypothetical protein
VTDVDCVIGAAPCLEPAMAAGYAIDEAEVTFWGLCPNCQQQPDQDIEHAQTQQQQTQQPPTQQVQTQ